MGAVGSPGGGTAPNLVLFLKIPETGEIVENRLYLDRRTPPASPQSTSYPALSAK
jgi:hypothetical protein